MRKVLSFSLFLMLGLVISQLLPGALGAGYASFKTCSDTLLYVCLGFIMINVGREFEIDKSRWRSYTADYFIAMATAALPWAGSSVTNANSSILRSLFKSSSWEGISSLPSMTTADFTLNPI